MFTIGVSKISYFFEIFLHKNSEIQRLRRQKTFLQYDDRNKYSLIVTSLFPFCMLLNVMCEHFLSELIHRVSSNAHFGNFLFFSFFLLFQPSTSLSRFDIFSDSETQLKQDSTVFRNSSTKQKIKYLDHFLTTSNNFVFK